MRSRRGIGVAGAALLIAALGAPAVAQEPMVEVVASGLDAPRGLFAASDGSIWLAQAGKAGDTCMGEGDSAFCMGPTGSISHISGGTVEDVITGLLSVGSGPEVGGVSDVTVADDGTIYFITNLGDDPANRANLPPEAANAGWLMKASPDGSYEPFADVAAYEANDPDADIGGSVDSNPYGITLTSNGVAVADAGGNDVLLVDGDGNVSLAAVIPFTTVLYSAAELAAMGPPPEGEGGPPADASAAPMENAAPMESAAPMGDESGEPTDGEAPAENGGDQMVPVTVQSVPTSVTVGPDGALYVGQLTGGPFPAGAAAVWRVMPGETPTQYATGFTNIVGLGFAPDGTLYVAEMVHEGLMGVFAGTAPPIGAVMSVAPDGGDPQMVATGEQFMALGGLAVDADGNVYVSTNTLSPGEGAVVKITP